eukprot:TRINITY_DN31611_c0_g1_i1.p1 TRINITY_DN31611_c0_g1~~TRINITY_DN31611_c0_g1_i1.p1  ORF type:complete len:193 (-),score=76.75 TRINITY_DN31611_c0_g1_i1:66-644(-)
MMCTVKVTQLIFFFFQAEDGIRDAQESRGLGDVYKRQLEERLREAGLVEEVEMLDRIRQLSTKATPADLKEAHALAVELAVRLKELGREEDSLLVENMAGKLHSAETVKAAAIRRVELDAAADEQRALVQTLKDAGLEEQAAMVAALSSGGYEGCTASGLQTKAAQTRALAAQLRAVSYTHLTLPTKRIVES